MSRHRHAPHVVQEDCSASQDDDGSSDCNAYLLIALAWVKARDVRSDVFGPDLFTDPAWSMLLDLYISHCRNIIVAASDLSIAAATPLATGLRWIALLEQRGFLIRSSDVNDRRRTHVKLTALGIEKTENVLAGVAESDRRLGIGRLAPTG